ncbi:mechanosensitive ion channel family protein [Martelella sp. HB161492]|uniref:mechanosensitive ion channel domain-containing protein n=1 Tax=Martelella sp. HB161492 TaxID=2720726 RepID=UPI00158FEE68|nr:mechanosensitive ion channel family protein [Martelella sp. HB161492]
MSFAQESRSEDLSAEAFVDRLEQEQKTIDAINGQITGLMANMEEAEATLRQRLVDAESGTLTEGDDISADMLQHDDAAALYKRRLERLSERQRLIDMTTLLIHAADKAQETALLLEHEIMLHDFWVERNMALSRLVEDRLGARELTAENLPPAFAFGPLDPPEQGSIWGARAARAALVAEAARKERAALEAHLADHQKALEAAEFQLADVTTRERLKNAFAGRAPADLRLTLDELTARIDAQSDQEQHAAAALAATVASERQAAAALQAMMKNGPSDAADGGERNDDDTETASASLREAQMTASLARRRLALEIALHTRLDDVVAAAEQSEESLALYRPLLEELVSNLQQGAVLVELAGLEQSSDLRQRLAEKRQALADLKAVDAETAELLSSNVDALDTSQAAVEKATRALEEAETNLERERYWAAFFDTAAGKDTSELVAALQPSRDAAALAAAAQSQAEAALAADAALGALDALAQARDRLRNPISLSAASDMNAFLKWRASIALAPEGPANIAAAPAGRPVTGNAVDPNSADSAAQPYINALFDVRQRRDIISERLKYFEDLAAADAAFDAGLDKAILAQTQLVAEIDANLARTRERWGAASVLLQRAESGTLNPDDLPGDIGALADRTAVIESEQRRNDAAAVLTELQERSATGKGSSVAPQMSETLNTLSTIYGQQIEALVSLIRFTEQFASLENIDNLDDITKHRLLREVRERFDDAKGNYRYLDLIFGGDELVDVDKLMNRYFEVLILLERRRSVLDDQEAQLKLAQDAAAALRPAIATLSDLTDAEQRLSRARLDLKATAVRAALDPPQAAAMIAAAEERTGLNLEIDDLPVIDVQDGATDRAEALLIAREQLASGLLTDWALAEGYAQWSAELDDMLAPFGGLDRLTRELNTLELQIVDQRREINQRIQRLTGFAFSDDPEAEGEETRRFIAGEIGMLNANRESLIRQKLLTTTSAILVIPVIALIVYLAGRRLGHHIFFRQTKETESQRESAERMRRGETLNDIFQPTWGVLVCTLAGIYLLKAFEVDITPIVASLGIFGLAVAFGAQALIRDIFSGFFLLVENQFSKGDAVRIGEIHGRVEEVGLRITTVRDFDTDELYYLRNGMISGVANGRGFRKIPVDIHLAYNADLEQATAVIKAQMEAIRNDPVYGPQIDDCRLVPGFAGLDYDHAMIVLRVYFLIAGPDWPTSKFRENVARKLLEAGIGPAIPTSKSYEIHSNGVAPT